MTTPYRLFLVIIFLLIQAHLVYAQTNKAKFEQHRKKVEEEIKYTNPLLEQTRKSKKTSLQEVIILNEMIGKREALISAVNTEINYLDYRVTVIEDSISELTDDLEELRQEYAVMIYFAYKNRDLYDRMMFIFAADDFNQAYQRLKYFQQYQVYRKKQAGLIEQTQESLEEKSTELILKKEEKEELMVSLENEKKQQTTEKQSKDATAQSLSRKERTLRKELKAKEKAILDLQAAIEKIIAEEIAARAREEESKSKELALTPEEFQLSSTFMSNKGKLPWPTDRGIISSTFGEHAHPILKKVKVRNNGIDILTNDGAEARAVFQGRVTRVMSVPNNNNVVIIRHGEYLTVYANLDRVYVREGDEVATKERIGTIFTNPDETRTELHFEVWKAKTLMNPIGWLARR